MCCCARIHFVFGQGESFLLGGREPNILSIRSCEQDVTICLIITFVKLLSTWEVDQLSDIDDYSFVLLCRFYTTFQPRKVFLVILCHHLTKFVRIEIYAKASKGAAKHLSSYTHLGASQCEAHFEIVFKVTKAYFTSSRDNLPFAGLVSRSRCAIS